MFNLTQIEKNEIENLLEFEISKLTKEVSNIVNKEFNENKFENQMSYIYQKMLIKLQNEKKINNVSLNNEQIKFAIMRIKIKDNLLNYIYFN